MLSFRIKSIQFNSFLIYLIKLILFTVWHVLYNKFNDLCFFHLNQWMNQLKFNFFFFWPNFYWILGKDCYVWTINEYDVNHTISIWIWISKNEWSTKYNFIFSYDDDVNVESHIFIYSFNELNVGCTVLCEECTFNTFTFAFTH